MAIEIPNEQLNPGDLVTFTFLEQGTPTEIALAVHDIKMQLATDPRFVYQGSREYDQEDGRYIDITVEVRNVSPNQAMPSLATGIAPIFIVVASVAAIYAIMKAAPCVQQGLLTMDHYVVSRMAANPKITEQAKQAALQTMRTQTRAAAATDIFGNLSFVTILVGGIILFLLISHRAS